MKLRKLRGDAAPDDDEGRGIIGATLAVPGGMDISCRSDLTQDMAPDAPSAPPPPSRRRGKSAGGGGRFSPRLSPPLPSPRSPAQLARDADLPPIPAVAAAVSSPPPARQRALLPGLPPTSLRRDVTGSSSSSFHTAEHVRGGSSAMSPMALELEGVDEGAVVGADDALAMVAGAASDAAADDDADSLDRVAEAAAVACFGSDADRKLDDEGPPRRSTLVSENSGIDVSWFAAKGLMSRRSFERYQKEMRSSVLQKVSLKSSLREKGDKGPRRPRGRRASVSMCDLRHQNWSTTVSATAASTTTSTIKPKKKTNDRPRRRATAMVEAGPEAPMFVFEDGVGLSPLPRKPRSCDDGLNELAFENKGQDDGLDRMVQSFITAFKKDATGSGRPPAVDVHDLTKLPTEEKKESKPPLARLESDEVRVLTKMLRRLTHDQETSPFEGSKPNGDDVRDGDDHVKGQWKPKGRGGRRKSSEDCSGMDLMDSATWNEDEGILSFTSQDEAKPSSKQEVGAAMKRTSSSLTIKASNESKISDLADKYVPKRSDSIELKGSRASFQLREVDFEASEETEVNHDSFHTTRFERNDTLSSNMLSTTAANDDLSDDDSIISDILSPVPAKEKLLVMRSNNVSTLSMGSAGGDNAPIAERRQVLEKAGASRSDTMSSLSMSEENEKDKGGTLAQHSMARIQSHLSLSTMGAIAPTELMRDDSLSTECTLSRWGDEGKANMAASTSEHLAGHTKTAKTDSTEASLHMSLRSGDKGIPRRRNSLSSDASPAIIGAAIRQNSFSSSSSSADLNDLDGPPMKEGCGDVLQEGMDHLSMAMLVNVYAKLRELSTLGHASVKLAEIDVNSHQSLAKRKEMIRRGLLPEQDSGEPRYFDRTKTAGAVVRTVLDEYEMFQASNELPTVFGSSAAVAYDANLLLEFKTWVEESRVRQLDRVTEEVIRNLRKECAAMRPSISKGQSTSNDSLSAMERAPSVVVRGCIARRRCSLVESSGSFQESMWLNQERKLIADHFGIDGTKLPLSRSTTSLVREDSRRLSKGVLTESMIERTLENSHEYFQEGSSLRNLLESGLEVVWFSDRHPDDIIYCICVNRETATVTVVFRGQESMLDLVKDSASSSYANPLVDEDYEGNSEFISLRSSVSDEMMRVRRDTKKSTMDEIRTKVDKIGKELLGGNAFHLSVTGHSLGGGLATIAGYYLASDPSLNVASAVRVFTFASARVGCKAFQQGFKHLEKTGRLQHARFATSNEPVSTLPFWNTYHHVGMQICLHKANNAGRQRARRSLDVSYDLEGNRIIELLCLAWNCLSTFKSSRISEYQHRLHFAREYRLALGDGVLRFDKKRNHLKSLNDYYLMKCRLNDFMDLTKKREMMPSFLVFFLVSCLISFELALLLKFVATW